MRRQAERWGAELFQEDVEYIDVKSDPFTVQSSERKVIYCYYEVTFIYLSTWLHYFFKQINLDFHVLLVDALR